MPPPWWLLCAIHLQRKVAGCCVAAVCKAAKALPALLARWQQLSCLPRSPPSHPQVHAAGQLITRDFVSMLPFTDELVLLELSGSDVLTALETGVGSWPALEGRFLQARAPQETGFVSRGVGVPAVPLSRHTPCIAAELLLLTLILLIPFSSAPQVSGLTFAFDSDKPSGSRVVRDSVRVAGEPLQLDTRYKASCPG